MPLTRWLMQYHRQQLANIAVENSSGELAKHMRMCRPIAGLTSGGLHGFVAFSPAELIGVMHYPKVAQAAVRSDWTYGVGLGRMMLPYPDLPAGRPPQRKRLCRTFSDCTTAPRHGVRLLSAGCALHEVAGDGKPKVPESVSFWWEGQWGDMSPFYYWRRT